MNDPDIERPAARAGRPRRPVDQDTGPIPRLTRELRELRPTAGAPTQCAPARRAHYAASTLAEAAKSERLPTPAITLCADECERDAFLRALPAHATSTPEQRPLLRGNFVVCLRWPGSRTS